MDQNVVDQMEDMYFEQMLSTNQIAKALHCTDTTVRKYLKTTGRSLRTISESILLMNEDRQASSEDIAAWGDMYKDGASMQHIATKYGFSKGYVRQRLESSQIEIRAIGSNRLYQLNEKVFDKLTDEAYYWLGYIATDGYVYRDGTLGVELQYGDKEQLVQLQKFLQSDYPILYRKVNHSWLVRTNSLYLVNRLLELGITPRKSLTLDIDPGASKSPYFWRGALDGDGSIQVPHRKASIEVQLFSASDLFTNSFCQFLVSYNLLHRVTQNHGVHRVTVGAKHAWDLLALVGYHDDCYSLQRKRKRADLIREHMYIHKSGRVMRLESFSQAWQQVYEKDPA